ncbi:hypothetical protein [Lactobacillus psittaci]|uniref:DUF1659 domain-containing protein n=1 Tax=Lactobacillus psittaci DSM 15354 TaxID=1122152 RepID=A0A0R1RYI6_9LACO|nr:hypothetical protein [Lactobacillus psittaci]KRL62028.1 hypothetical protein FC23_GL000404 [Lactobacillus psittaci DSM 15354]
MNFELKEQEVQYTFVSEKYKNNKKTRIMKNVAKGATAQNLANVGKALSSLQDDTLGAAVLIQKQNIVLD